MRYPADVPWISEDPQWHGESGPGIECAGSSGGMDGLSMACRLDTNVDGIVGVDDLLAMLATYGRSC